MWLFSDRKTLCWTFRFFLRKHFFLCNIFFFIFLFEKLFELWFDLLIGNLHKRFLDWSFCCLLLAINCRRNKEVLLVSVDFGLNLSVFGNFLVFVHCAKMILGQKTVLELLNFEKALTVSLIHGWYLEYNPHLNIYLQLSNWWFPFVFQKKHQKLNHFWCFAFISFFLKLFCKNEENGFVVHIKSICYFLSYFISHT